MSQFTFHIAAFARTSPNADVRDSLRRNEKMDMATRYREALVVLETKFGEHHRAWRHHGLWIAEHGFNIETSYPDDLSEDTWMTHQALSRSVRRLSAVDHALRVRHAMLNAFLVQTERASLEEVMLSSVSKPAVGPETHLWKAISAIAEATDALNEELELITQTEERLSRNIKKLGLTIFRVGNRFRSDRFVTLCSIQRTRETLEQDLSEQTNMPYSTRQEHEKKLEACVKILKSMGSPHGLLASIQYLMFNIGINTPRQTLITEYLKSGNDGDVESEDDTWEEGEEGME